VHCSPLHLHAIGASSASNSCVACIDVAVCLCACGLHLHLRNCVLMKVKDSYTFTVHEAPSVQAMQLHSAPSALGPCRVLIMQREVNS
jgi:hypothetical protein